MDIEKLIERLRENTDCWTDKVHGYAGLRLEAAISLAMLQAENAQLRAYLEYEREHADAYYEECGQWEAENEKLRAELEKVKAEFEEERAAVVDVDKAILWLKDYVFEDSRKIYTNGSRLIPYFRVLQAFRDKAYNGLQEGRA